MRYLSTRGGSAVSAAEAIVRGICPLGGLYVPERFPALDAETLVSEAENYHSIAAAVMEPYLEELPVSELQTMLTSAYGKRFDTPAVTPLAPLDEHVSMLELWHGPTLAFKDIALQMLPHLMRFALRETGEERTIYILVATSGDTGKAALEGFRDMPGTKIQVFYPYGGVSRAQRLQMVTQEGGNVYVCAVRGNFDDAQTAVKRIFGSAEENAKVAAKGCRLSSANSINFGRLVPQIAYYFAAYAQLRAKGTVKAGEAINFCVPTGNFGDILAGYYAAKMGLPVNRFICASNRNNVLTDFFRTGNYDSRRPFYKSMSCSIDILVSSNLERLLYDASGHDPAKVQAWMKALSGDRHYTVGDALQEVLEKSFWASCCTEEDTLATIKAVFERSGYLMDPHTAVAQTAYERYAQETGDPTHTVVLSTANPFKFSSDVLRAFETPAEDDFINNERLSVLSGAAIPAAIAALKSKPELHNAVCALEDMPKRVLEVL